MYLISRSFQKIAKFKSVWVCVRVCVCVCIYICVCVYKYDKSKQCYSCHVQNTTSRITLRNVTKFQKFLKNFKNLSLIHDATLYLLKMLLHFLVDQNFVYIKTVMKTRSYMHCFLTLLCQVVT